MRCSQLHDVNERPHAHVGITPALFGQVPSRGRQHARAGQHGVHEQPRPPERGVIPGLQPASGLAVGRRVLRDDADRPPPLPELGKLAQHRWSAALNQNIQHREAILDVRPERSLRPSLDPGASLCAGRARAPTVGLGRPRCTPERKGGILRCGTNGQRRRHGGFPEAETNISFEIAWHGGLAGHRLGGQVLPQQATHRTQKFVRWVQPPGRQHVRVHAAN